MNQNRIVIEPFLDLPALRMTWAHESQSTDVIVAYNEIMTYLNNSNTPLDVLVDLRKCPALPMQETVAEALEGPYKHPMLRKWLIIGGDSLAHAASNMLFGIAGEQKILWFNELEDAEDYLHASHLVNSN